MIQNTHDKKHAIETTLIEYLHTYKHVITTMHSRKFSNDIKYKTSITSKNTYFELKSNIEKSWTAWQTFWWERMYVHVVIIIIYAII